MRVTRTAVAVVATAVAVVAPPAVAQAGLSSYEDRALPVYFENEEYALYTVVSLDGPCRGEGFPVHSVHIVQPPEGRVIAHSRYEEPLSLYDLSEWGADSAEDLIEIVCTAVNTGEGTVPVPLATGEGAVTYHSINVDQESGVFVDAVRRSAKGELTDSDGDVYSVKGRDKRAVTFTSGGETTEDITFSTLDVRYLG